MTTTVSPRGFPFASVILKDTDTADAVDALIAGIFIEDISASSIDETARPPTDIAQIFDDFIFDDIIFGDIIFIFGDMILGDIFIFDIGVAFTALQITMVSIVAIIK
jgi:hypothetical protein